MSKDYSNYIMGFNQFLAKNIGINEAILLNQIDYWLSRTQHFINDKPWIYNSYKDWQTQFPFWSKRTIRRLFSSLEQKGIILSSNFNKSKTDRTKWYSIDFEQISSLKKKQDTDQEFSYHRGGKSRVFNHYLAKEIGLNEAIFANQINYLLLRTKHFFRGDPWIYNSYEAWKTHFPFWSKSTIIRTIASLERQGILLSKTLNKSKKDQTKWYSLNFEKIPSLKRKEGAVIIGKFLCNKNKNVHAANMNRASQNNIQDVHFHVANMSHSLKEQNTNLQKKERAVGTPEKINLAKTYIKTVKKNIYKSFDTWSLSDDERLNTSKNINWDQERIDNELLRFKTYYADKIRKNWDTTWQMWCVRAERFAQERKQHLETQRKDNNKQDYFIDFTQMQEIENEAKLKVDQDLLEKKKTAISHLEKFWLKVSEKMVLSIGNRGYISWIKDLVLEKIEENVVVLKARGRFLADYIQIHLMDKILNAFKTLLPDVVQIMVII